MAAPTTEQVGIDFVLKADTNVIGGQTGATLSPEANTTQINSASGNTWRRTLPTLKDWSIDFDSLWLEGSTPEEDTAFGMKIEAEDGTSTLQEIKGINEATLSLSLEMVEFTNQEHANFTARIPSIKTANLDVTTDYFDPAGDNAGLEAVLSDYDNDTDSTVKITLPSTATTFDADMTLASYELDAPFDDGVEMSLTFENNGVVTESLGSLDSGLNTLLTSFFADPPTKLTALLTTETSGATEWTGDTFPESLEISLPVTDPIEVSGTLVAADQLTRSTTT